MLGAVTKVSVIVPAYNHEQWIVEALHSVVQQSLSNWELIIIDDASTDRTWQCIEDFCQQHHDLQQSITYRRHRKNQGAPATLNEALQLANGQYLAILNSDDVWHSQRLECLYQYATQGGYDFLASRLLLWDANSKDKAATETDWLSWYQGLQDDWQAHHDPLRTFLRGNVAVTTSNFFWRRSVHQQLKSFADLRYVHDYEYLLRLLDAGFSVGYVWQEALLYYRLHGHNTIREQPLAAIQENMHMLLNQLGSSTNLLTPLRTAGLALQLNDLYRYTGEEWLTRIHEALVKKEQELFPLIEDRDGWIRERDQWLQSQAEAMVLLEQQKKQLSQELQQQHAALLQRETWLQQRDSWVSDRDDWIKQRDGWIADRDNLILERDTYIVALQAQQQDLLNSRRYRLGVFLSKPLDYARRLLERLRLRMSYLKQPHA